MADHLALDDIEFELEEFNRAFNVKGADGRSRPAFCDQKMMRWLLTTRGCGFEIVGDRLLTFCRKVVWRPSPLLFATMCGLRDHVPPVVYSLYPR